MKELTDLLSHDSFTSLCLVVQLLEHKMHIAVLINLLFWKGFPWLLFTNFTCCDDHRCSPWSYLIALGWLKCRLLQRNTAVLKFSSCARACGAAWWARRVARLWIQISLGQFYLVYWPRKCYSWCKGEKIARGGTKKGRHPFCVSLTLTGLKWPWSPKWCLRKGDSYCAWEFTVVKGRLFVSEPSGQAFPELGIYECARYECVRHIWVSHFPYHFIQVFLVFFVAQNLWVVSTPPTLHQWLKQSRQMFTLRVQERGRKYLAF